jgi:hypothetical protein
MGFLSNLFGNKQRPVRKATRLRLENLEERSLPSSTPLAALADMHNPVISQVASVEYERDGQLTRSDVIHLFNVADGTETPHVSADGTNVTFTPLKTATTVTINASKLADLRAVAKDAAEWGLTDDVANLSNKVVNYNLSNKQYDGKAFLANGVVSSANSVAVMQKLVGKWFLGTDLPLTAAGTHYAAAAGNLLGANGPAVTDIAQGEIGDCYFMSSLGETSLKDPQAIKDMFINDGNGVYTVRFFEMNQKTGEWTADYVTVNSQLPVDAYGRFYYANMYQYGHTATAASSNNVLWAALAEKGFVQLSQEGQSQGSRTRNSYASINSGDPDFALQELTGDSNADWISTGWNGTAADVVNTLITDFQNGNLIEIATVNTPTNKQLVGNHAYMMTGYDAANQTITITNPWAPGLGVHTVTLTVADFAKSISGAADVSM